MQKQVPVECEAGKIIYFKLRQPPYWKGWILHPYRPQIILEPIALESDHIILSKNDLSQEDVNSFARYLTFRIDEILQWIQKSRIMLELEFMHEILCKVDVFSKEELQKFDERIRSIYKSYYYTPKCGAELYAALRNNFTPTCESDIEPFNFHAEDIAYLKRYFFELMFKNAREIIDTKVSANRDKKCAELRSVLGKVSFWSESQQILRQACLIN